MSRVLRFPPLMWGEAAPGDALEHACLRAAAGCDAGLVSYRLGGAEMQAALVLVPEVPLARAMTMLPLAAVGLHDALGALAPPELAVHLTWEGGIRVNGAACGGFRAVAATTDPQAVPDWLAVGFTLPLRPETEETGTMPDRTWLMVEGCADVDRAMLIEAWARHTLNWIARWEEEGPRPLHEVWRGLAHGIGEPVCQDGISGIFLGVDEDFGMLIRLADRQTRLVPLTRLLEAHP